MIQCDGTYVRSVLVSNRIFVPVPANICAHARLIRIVLPILLSVLQCWMKMFTCPSPCRTFQGMKPPPPRCWGQINKLSECASTLSISQDPHTVSILGGKLEGFVLATNVDWRMYVVEIQTNEKELVHGWFLVSYMCIILLLRWKEVKSSSGEKNAEKFWENGWKKVKVVVVNFLHALKKTFCPCNVVLDFFHLFSPNWKIQTGEKGWKGVKWG